MVIAAQQLRGAGAAGCRSLRGVGLRGVRGSGLMRFPAGF